VRFAALVLAAGSARRFGSDKLSASFLGCPMLDHAIAAARAAPVERVLVVCGNRGAIGTWEGAPVVDALQISSTALSQSLNAGLAAAGDVDGAFVFLGDMPLIPHDVAGRLAGLLGANFAAVPRHNCRNGHPVLLARRAFAEIARLTDDDGARRLLRQRDDIARLEVTSDAILLDVDQREDMALLARRAHDR
jgi:molybdenum cofactor cytidylyltransferase